MAVNEYVQIELFKKIKTTIDLTQNFQGRVGDSQSYLNLWFYANGVPFNLQDYEPYFAGIDPVGQQYEILGTTQASNAADNWQAGKVTFTFPGGTFVNEGYWDADSTFFGIRDSNGVEISSVGVSLHVLPNRLFAGFNQGPIISRVDQVVDEAKKKLDTLQDRYQSASKLIDAINVQLKGNDFPTAEDIARLTANLKVLNAVGSSETPAEYITNNPSSDLYEVKAYADVQITASNMPSDVTLAGKVLLHTVVPGTSAGDGYPIQTAKTTGTTRPVTLERVGTSNTTWGAWSLVTTW